MNDNKGFTLIELLSVIVILSVILVIAVPLILNAVNGSKEKAAKISTKEYIEILEAEIISGDIYVDGNDIKDGIYYVSDLDVSYKGEGPSKGYVVLKNGIVNDAHFCIKKCSIDYSNGISNISDNNYCN